MGHADNKQGLNPARWPAVVEASEPGSEPGFLPLRLLGAAGCAACSGGGCSIARAGQQPILLPLAGLPGSTPRPGQRVLLEIDGSVPWLRIILSAYGWPVLGLLIGALGAQGLWVLSGAPAGAAASDLWVLCGASSGLVGGIFAWHQTLRHRCPSSELAGLQGLPGVKLRIVPNGPVASDLESDAL